MKFNPLILDKIRERSAAMYVYADALERVQEYNKKMEFDGEYVEPVLIPTCDREKKAMDAISYEVRRLCGFDNRLMELYQKLCLSIKKEQYEDSAWYRDKIMRYPNK